MQAVKLLDCTLRDGGYVNDWEFGSNNIINVFERLVSAGMDIIEVGFLDERRAFDCNRTIMPNTKAVNAIYGNLEKGSSMVVGMIDYGTCGIENLLPCEECFLDGIRIIFKKEVMYDAIAFCREVKALGYRVFAQAVSITSYNDEELAELIHMVNELKPYAFSLVDTYGLLHKNRLMHYFVFADKHLDSEIGIGYHAHNNFQLAYANCIELIGNPPKTRMLLIDGSLYGMGKHAGNAPIELLAMYMSEQCHTEYDGSQLLEAIDVTILDIYRRIPWGYSLKFFVAASHDCHPSYVMYLMDKKKLSIRSIHEILNKIEPYKKLLYDKSYIEKLYVDYQTIECDDAKTIDELTALWKGKSILLLGSGNNIVDEQEKAMQFIEKEQPITIAINFLPEGYKVDYIFVSNAKRYVQLSSQLNQIDTRIKLIATSNVTKSKGTFDYTLQYGELLDEKAKMVDNPLIMLIKILKNMGLESIALAGFDGYTTAPKSDYVNPNMEYSFSTERAIEINEDVEKSLLRLRCKTPIQFITSTKYKYEKALETI